MYIAYRILNSLPLPLPPSPFSLLPPSPLSLFPPALPSSQLQQEEVARNEAEAKLNTVTDQMEENQKTFDTQLQEKDNEIRQLKEEVCTFHTLIPSFRPSCFLCSSLTSLSLSFLPSSLPSLPLSVFLPSFPPSLCLPPFLPTSPPSLSPSSLLPSG